jgi:arsenate reductase
MTDEICVLFNPRCSKCRQTKELLDEAGEEATYVHYLDEPLPRERIEEILGLLGESDPRAMMRTGEPVYRELGLADATQDDLIDAMVTHPILIERPIVITGGRAVIARPPDRVRELLT